MLARQGHVVAVGDVHVLPHARGELLECHQLAFRVCVGAGAAPHVHCCPRRVPLVWRPSGHHHIHGAPREGEDRCTVIRVLQSHSPHVTGARAHGLVTLRHRTPRHGNSTALQIRTLELSGSPSVAEVSPVQELQMHSWIVHQTSNSFFWLGPGLQTS